MKLEDIYQYFGSSRKAAKAINITRSAVSHWETKGYIPFNRQKKIELITKGNLIASRKDIKKIYEEGEDCEDAAIYLPMFRYYDKGHGLCNVASLHFRKGKPIKIIYITNKIGKIITFDTKNLMQASNLVDRKGKILYEGDICKLKNGKKFIFKTIKMTNQLKKLGKFEIIGNILEG
jgi:DNA-binding transcriptional regulator Cro/YopX protein